MEHIGEILKQVRTNTPGKDTDTSSNTDAAEPAPEPVCPTCRGARFVHPLKEDGRPDYSQVVPCHCTQKEAEDDRRGHLLRYSNLGALTRFAFDNLEPQGRSDHPVNRDLFAAAYQAALKFAESPEGWLVLTGPSGSGKTHLAVAIANRCIDTNRPAFYITTPDLLDHLRSSFSPSSEIPYDEFFDQVRNAPLLILDDLGAQSATSWAKEKLEQVLSHRYSSRLPTVVVSILPLDQLEDRMRTRLEASDVYALALPGDDTPGTYPYGWSQQFKKQQAMIFENFDWKRPNLPLDERDNLRAAFQIASEFAESPEGWLVFQGTNGCGKTHLAAAIVNKRYEKKKPALFIVVPDFLDHLRSSFSPDSRISYDQYFESVKNAPLLVLDDFGKQTTTPWAQEKLYQVINHRYNAQLPTVITTNCSADELDAPILSRFADPRISTNFWIMAPDYYAGRHGGDSPSPRGKSRR